MLNLVVGKMIKTVIKIFIATLAIITFWSCSKASGHGTFTIVLSGSVHGQLDPCG